MTFKLALTGSIGMGKSTTAAMFADLGCAVWDADAAVHRLYAKEGAAVKELQKIWPEAFVDGAVSRERLRDIVSNDPDALTTIEDIVHPLVAQDRADFLTNTKSDIVVLDIPLLFETGAEKEMDAVACVYVPDEVQEQRVMERGTMTQAQFEQIRAKQLPNTEKCARADFVIPTETLEGARAQVQTIVADIRKRLQNA